jgi:HK97 family phage major capsid protein
VISKTLSSRFEAHKKQTAALFAEIEAKGDAASADERTKLQNMFEAGKAMMASIEAARAMDSFDGNDGGGTPAAKTIDNGTTFKSLGQRFAEAKAFKERGQNSKLSVQMQAKANEIVGVTGIGGALHFPVQPQRMTDIYGIPRVGLEILNAFARGETNSNAFTYFQQVLRTNNAAETEELGAKPQSAYDWDEVTATVRTIAHYVITSEQVLDDEPRLRSIIDDELMQGVLERLQSQLLSGNGTAPNLRGVLNTAGTNNRVHATSGARFDAADTRSDTIRKMLTDVRLANGVATLVILNPADGEKIELEREGAGTGQYLKTYDVATGRIWRVPVLEHNSIPAGTALAGDFARGAKYYMRDDVKVETDRINDQFIKNAFTIRAEMRAAFTVPYPAFFAKATGL